MKVRARRVLVIAGISALPHCGPTADRAPAEGPVPVPSPAAAVVAAPAVVPVQDLADLRARFERDRDRPRLIVLLSPT